MKLKKYKSQKNDDLNNKLKSYSVLTGAFLLTAGAAQSQIIYTDFDPDSSIIKTTFDIDFDHDGIKDFAIRHATSYYGAEKDADLKPGINPANRVMAVSTQFNFFPNNYILNLPAGNPIGPGGPFYSFGSNNDLRIERRWIQYTNSQMHVFTGGFWLDSTGYIGVEFNSNGNTYYGWIECSIDPVLDSIVVKGYAYESTPNTYIIAGSGKTTGIQEKQLSIDPVGSFYPNPAIKGKTFIKFESKQNSELKIEIINGMGQVLLRENRSLISGKNIVEMDVNFLTNGTYFVKLMEGGKTYYRKILISK